VADLRFSSFAQPQIGQALQQADTGGPLGAATFQPALTLVHPDGTTSPLLGPSLSVIGAGSAVGLEPRAVLRTDPPAGSGDVETTYLASVELAPVELPWLLTPARPGGAPDALRLRLRPWIVLVVVRDTGDTLQDGSPLPTITVDVGELPDLADSWAWAHVQQPGASDVVPGLPAVGTTPIARLVCPRRLEPSQRWLACIVPAFDGGRATGLGLPLPDGEHAPAWDVGAPGTVQLPVLASWQFATGEQGDFESLVRRLRPLDEAHLAGLGVRMVDAAQPWPEDTPLTGTNGPATIAVSGALRSFAAVAPGTLPDAALADFRARLQAQLNAPADRVDPTQTVPDSTGAVAPPIYGGRHFPHDRVLQPPTQLPPTVFVPPDWVTQLNFDIAARVAAGIGSAYIRAHQEELMAKAWEQVGAIREANRRRRIGELAVAVSASLHRRHVTTLQPGEVVALAAPAAARTRVTDTGTTLATETNVSTLADGAASSAFARLVRPSGPVARAASTSAASVVARGLAALVAVPQPAILVDRLPGGAEGGTADPLGTTVVSAVVAGQADLAATRVVALQAVTDVARANGLGTQADQLQGQLGAIAVDTGLARVGRVGDIAVSLQLRLASVATIMSNTVALLGSPPFTDAGPARVLATGIQVDPSSLATRLVTALQPTGGITARIASRSVIPAGLSPSQPLDPVMAYPRFPVPVGLALLQDFPEWFLPGVGAVPAETATLLRTDATFVESFLVGLAQEFNRELRWREFPTDLRGTPFDRFWPRPDGAPDIPPITTWREFLGTNLDSSAGSVVVLLVRGTVIRRFPDIVIAAVPKTTATDPATWLAPIFVIPVDAQTAAYAFPLSPDQVRAPEPGYWFAFHEHGYRLRFGFDETSASFDTWNDLDWTRVPQERGFAIAGRLLAPPANPGDARWDRDAADTARIALQWPFRVLISARRLIGG
jgi:hypothetical protein